jgi:hypothetical protein
MNKERACAVIIAMMLMGAGLLAIPVSFVSADAVYKQVLGIVDPNSVTLVAAYDPVPADNGWTYFYIQNRTNEGTGTDPMTQLAGFDVYDPEIYINVSDWMIGDECINVVNRDYGSYGVDHAGYVAFMNMTLTDLAGTDVAPTTELMKIPTPILVGNGSDYIEISWPAITDPNGLVAGYTVYSSPTNGTTSGDAEWTLQGGTVNAPITGTSFNNTPIIPGNYYYSIKVVFIGYTMNNPANVDNYESAYFGEGSALMQIPVGPVTGVDYIVITNGPDGTPYVLEPLGIGGTLTAFASGYNNSGPTYIGLVEVDWSGLGGSWAPGTGTSSDFTAGTTPGIYTQTGQNGSLMDTFDVDILTPTVDYIVITDMPDGLPLGTVTLGIGGTVTAYASGYNNTAATYVGLVEVDWTGLGGTWLPLTGTSSVYTADITAGLFTQTGQNASMPVLDTFDIDILPPTVDYIVLTDGPDGPPLGIVVLDIGGTVTAFASGYNNTAATYVGLVSVDWIDNGGSWSPSTGTSSTFTAGVAGGIFNQVGQNTGMSVIDDFDVDINPPTVDYILITDAPDGTELTTVTLAVTVGTVTAYASGYNNTAATYVGLVEVDWTGGGGAWLPILGTSSTYTAGGSAGLYTLTGQNASMVVIDTFDVDILDVILDYITITDAPDGGALTTVVLLVGGTVTAYASGYNLTGPTYMGLFSVDWSGLGGGWAPTTGTSSTYTAGMAGGLFTQTGLYVPMSLSDTFDVDITPPTVDYILIVDNPGTGLTEIGATTVNVGDTITGYAAGFNNTALYIGDVTVTWSVSNSGGATATSAPGSGDTSVFDAELTGGVGTWTATYPGSITDTVDITITPPTVDYILIVDNPGTGLTEIPTQTLGVGISVIGYAASFNNTALYLGDISVTWTVTPSGGATSTTTPGPSDTATFSSDDNGGTAIWEADDGTHTDTVDFTITPPVRDYITIVDTSGIGTTEIPDQIVDVKVNVTGYAAAFNNTIGYLGDINVIWSTLNAGGAGASTFPLSGSATSEFTSGTAGGSCTWTADDGLGHSDTVVLTINAPTVDYITIVDTAATGTTEIPDQGVGASFLITGYAASFNNSVGYLGDISVDWTVVNTGSAATTTLGPSDTADFDSKLIGGTATWTADDGTNTDTVVFTITGQQADSIKIMDAADNLGSEVTDMTYGVYDTDFFYCAAFDGTTYLGDVDPTWISSATAVGTIDDIILPATFTAQLVTATGTCVVTATYNSLTDDTGTLTVLAPTPDYIQIRNAPGGAGTVVTTRTFGVGGGDEFYASAHNFTTGYISDVSADWESDATAVGQVTTPGEFTTFTAQDVDTQSTCTVKATYLGLENTTELITVLVPTIDEIRIRTAANDGGTVLDADITMNVGATGEYFAAGYNATSGYIEDIAGAIWGVTNSIGTIAPASGDSTIITATTVGTGTLTVAYSGVTNESADIEVVSGADVTPPDQLDEPIVKVDGDEIDITIKEGPETDINKYVIQKATSSDGPWENITELSPGTTTYTDSDTDPDTKYYYRVVAVDDAGNPSPPSQWTSATTDPEDAFPWLLLILLLIIIVVVILLLIIMAKKKKPEEEMPPGAAAEAAPSEEMEEAPVEEEFAPEEEEFEGGEVEEEYAPEESYQEETEFEEEPATDEGGYEEETAPEETEYEEEPDSNSSPPPPPPPPPPA